MHPKLLTLWCGEVDDVAVRLEHVHLLNRLDWLHVHLFEGALQLLVVGARAPLDLLDLSSWCSLASVCQCCQIMCLYSIVSSKSLCMWTCGRSAVRNMMEWFLPCALISITLMAYFYLCAACRGQHVDLPMRTAFCMRASFSVSMLAAEEISGGR